MADEDAVALIEVSQVSTLVSDDRSTGRERSAALARIFAWCLFGVGFAWVPLVVGVLAGSETARHVSLTTEISHGDLALVAAVITAGALGDLFVAVSGARKNRDDRYTLGGQPVTWVLTAGLLTLSFTLSAMYYAVVQFGGSKEQGPRVAHLSIVMFACAFVVSVCALVQTEKRSLT
jgi:hypothetical protein